MNYKQQLQDIILQPTYSASGWLYKCPDFTKKTGTFHQTATFQKSLDVERRRILKQFIENGISIFEETKSTNFPIIRFYVVWDYIRGTRPIYCLMESRVQKMKIERFLRQKKFKEYFVRELEKQCWISRRERHVVYNRF